MLSYPNITRKSTDLSAGECSGAPGNLSAFQQGFLLRSANYRQRRPKETKADQSRPKETKNQLCVIEVAALASKSPLCGILILPKNCYRHEHSSDLLFKKAERN
jgi:hypothetical protein